ncbi:MAG: hypothetical protein ACRDUT_00115 [Mycobacterium sp.]
MGIDHRRQGRYDPATARRSTRKQREKGVWIYVPAVELEKAGFDPEGAPPTYRVWGRHGGGLAGRFYHE